MIYLHVIPCNSCTFTTHIWRRATIFMVHSQVSMECIHFTCDSILVRLLWNFRTSKFTEWWRLCIMTYSHFELKVTGRQNKSCSFLVSVGFWSWTVNVYGHEFSWHLSYFQDIFIPRSFKCTLCQWLLVRIVHLVVAQSATLVNIRSFGFQSSFHTVLL